MTDAEKAVKDAADKALADKAEADRIAASKAAKKLELTEDELAALLHKEREKLEKKYAADKEAERKKADEDAAKQKGEFQKLYESEVALRKADQSERDAAKLDLKRERALNRMRALVAKDHPDYLGVVDEWMAPKLAVALDSPDEAIDKDAAKIVKSYIDANPRTVKAGAPGAVGARGKALGDGSDKTKGEIPLPHYIRR